MMILWMMILSLSDRKVKSCSVKTAITVSPLSKVSISCPSNTDSFTSLKYLLLLNDSCISQIQLSKDSPSIEGLFSSQYEVTVNKSGVYICQKEVIYPPPFKMDCHSTEVIVAEKQNTSETVRVVNQNCKVKSPLIPEVVLWAVCGILLVYSLSITCISCSIFLRRKMERDEEDKNVYINTKPGELRKYTKT